MNPFSLLLQKDAIQAMNELGKRPGFVLGKNNHHLLSEREKYTSRVFRIQSALVSTSEQLLHIKIYLNRYPFRKYYFEKGISQLDYIQYHTETLFHKVHTVLEIMKLLLNEVCQLEIPPKDCSWIALLKKMKKTDPSMECLDRYFNAFQHLIELRHRNTHRGYYEDNDKERIDVNYGLMLYKEEINGYEIDREIKKKLPIEMINHLLKKHKETRVKLVEKVIVENEKQLTAFLATLHQPYLKQLTIFDS